MQAFANPVRFLRLTDWLVPIAAGLAGTSLLVGLYLALIASPADYQQGDGVRIMYVHVPAAWLALGGYTGLALSSLVFLVWKHPLADTAARAIAPAGALFTLVCLVTGALWGKPMWGAWWVWDARLTSVLVLFFLYAGHMALREAIDDRVRAAKAAAILALVGFVNVPIIKFSVDWWNTLHQPASVLRLDGPTIHGPMLWALLVMMLGMTALFALVVMLRVRTDIFERRAETLQAQAGAGVSRARLEDLTPALGEAEVSS